MIKWECKFNKITFLKNKDKWESDFNFVPVAASLIYGIGFIVPVVVCFLMRFFGSQVHYVQVICIYGYSYSCFLIVVFLCIIPNDVNTYSINIKFDYHTLGIRMGTDFLWSGEFLNIFAYKLLEVILKIINE